MNSARLNETRIEFVVVTPEIASEWLSNVIDEKKCSHRQRKIKPRVVDKYSLDMKAGDWIVNGETIKFDKKGQLTDGQHRLIACVDAGVSFGSYVIWDVPTESFFTIDTGSARSNRDIFTMSGYNNAGILATATSFVWKYKNKKLHTNSVPSPSQAFSVLQEHGGLYSSVAHICSCAKKSMLLPIGSAAGMHYIFSETDSEKADMFFELVYSGEGLHGKSPILLLRNRLINERVSKTKMKFIDKIALIIVAWNNYVSNQDIGVLRWSSKTRGQRIPDIT